MKGIILAGGAGTRLYPVTQGVSKQLLPVYNKPMIYFPLSVLMLAGIRDILIITTPEDNKNFKRLLGNGDNFGISLQYAIQETPDGIAQALIIGERFINNEQCALILGDNVFYGQAFSKKLKRAAARPSGATIFSYRVRDPERFGIVEFDEDMTVLSVEEKPAQPKSPFAVTGLYFFDNKAVEYSYQINPSARGELEIMSLIQMYLEDNSLSLEILGRGFAWLDTGTHESLQKAASFVQTVEDIQGLQVACIEEIAWRNGWLSTDELIRIAENLNKNSYGRYLMSLLEVNRP